MSIPAPRWDLTNVYPSLESEEFKEAIEGFKTKVADLEDYFVEAVNKADENAPPDQLGPIIGEVVNLFNDVYKLSSTLEPYIYSFVSTDSHNKTAMRTMSEYEQAKDKWVRKTNPLKDLIGNADLPVPKNPTKENPLDVLDPDPTSSNPTSSLRERVKLLSARSPSDPQIARIEEVAKTLTSRFSDMMKPTPKG